MSTVPEELVVITPADHVAGPPQGQWTYADYMKLPEDGYRYELLDGVLFMAPAPGTGHQGSSSRFVYHLMSYVEIAGLGRVFAAPIDVELSLTRVVQPDIIVILNENLGIITPSRIVGAPDLVVEIASPSTAGYDRREKQDAYAAAGVHEYWIADPATRTIEVLALDGVAYRSLNAFTGRALLPSRVLAGFPVRVEELFGGKDGSF
jgi:Uma2 family endonuclease